MLRFQTDPLGGGGLPPDIGGGGPASSIMVPRGGGDSVGSPGASGGGQPGPDNPKVEALVNQAADLLGQALNGEKDAEDKALLSKIQADLHNFLGKQQKLTDSAMGAGPGVKILRKGQ